MRARGAMPLILPNAAAGPVAGTLGVAARGGGGVGAVAAVVARRVELLRQLRLDAGVAAPAGVVVARADQLLIAVAAGEGFARRALAVPAGDLLVASLPSFVALPLTPVRSEKLGCSGQMPPSTMPMMTPSPLALVSQKPSGPVRPRKARRGRGVHLARLVLGHREHARHRASFCACSAVNSAAKPLKTSRI